MASYLSHVRPVGIAGLGIAGILLLLVAQSGAVAATDSGSLPGLLLASNTGLEPNLVNSPLLVWNHSNPSSSPTFSGCSAAAYDDVLRAPICIGQMGSGPFTSLWEYQKAGWNNITPPGPQPNGRALGPMVPDDENLLVLLPVVGANGQVDTWGFSGTQWLNLSANGTPPASTDPAMAFDPLDGYVVLFGGMGGPCPGASTCHPENTTWIYVGNDWVNITGTAGPAPPARELAGLAFDPVQAHLVLFGGSPDGSRGMNDTWTFSYGLWHHLTLPSESIPAARSFECIGFDTPLGSIVVANGLDLGAARTDTWLLNSSGWTEDNAVGALSALCSAYSTVFDVRDGYLLTVAYSGPLAVLGNETWVLWPVQIVGGPVVTPWPIWVLLGFPAAGALGFVLAVFYVHSRRGRGSPPSPQ